MAVKTVCTNRDLTEWFADKNLYRESMHWSHDLKVCNIYEHLKLHNTKPPNTKNWTERSWTNDWVQWNKNNIVWVAPINEDDDNEANNNCDMCKQITQNWHKEERQKWQRTKILGRNTLNNKNLGHSKSCKILSHIFQITANRLHIS